LSRRFSVEIREQSHCPYFDNVPFPCSGFDSPKVRISSLFAICSPSLSQDIAMPTPPVNRLPPEEPLQIGFVADLRSAFFLGSTQSPLFGIFSQRKWPLGDNRTPLPPSIWTSGCSQPRSLSIFPLMNKKQCLRPKRMAFSHYKRKGSYLSGAHATELSACF